MSTKADALGSEIPDGGSSVPLDMGAGSALLELAGYVVEHVDVSGHTVRVSNNCRDMLGLGPSELVGRPFGEIAPANQRGRLADALTDWRAGLPSTVIYEAERSDGARVWLHSRGYALQGTAGVLVLTRDVSAERRTQQQRDRLDAALQNVPQGILMFDAGGRLVLFNEPYVALYGIFTHSIRAGMTLRDVIEVCRTAGCYAGRRTDEVLAELTAIFDRPAATWIDRPEPDRLIAMRVNAVDGAGRICCFEDVTERQRAADQIASMALQDSLTGLANRDMLHNRFGEETDRLQRTGNQMALLCLDLDRFKPVNDVLGHSAGDSLLQQVAARLLEMTRPSDVVARIGGDEFIVLQTSAPQPDAAAALADRLIDALSQPFSVSSASVRIGASIGIAIYPDDGTSANELLRNADVALYCAKTDGRGRYGFYDRAVGERQRMRRLLEDDLRQAVGTPQIDLHYQPIVDCDQDVVRGFEALMRWTHPLLGPVSPEVFIPIAEETGLIGPLGLWALEKACNEAATWPGRLAVAVNLSPAQFFTGDLHTEVALVLRRTGLLASRLELEVTEGLLISNTDQALVSLQALRAIGVGLALDDFGTGYASLGSLQKFPFSRLKIARSFIQALNKNTGADGIVSAILAMSRSLYLDVTAEGIETAEQLATLRRHGCSVVQGNLLGKPIAAREIAAYLRRPSGFMGVPAPMGAKPSLLV